MYSALFVIYAIIVAATATPIYVHECGVLDSPLATYQLANDILISNLSYGYVCLNIKGNGITLDGNGYQLSSASGSLLSGTGVQKYSGTGATVTNLRVSNLRTAIHANAKFGKVYRNTITRAVNGIDVTAPNNEIYDNTIKDFEADDSASGIYVYFPAMVPVDSSISITNNIISDIQGDSFALGISVYYATSVYIANNQIFNLRGLISEEISIINGDAKLVDNVFSPADEYSTTTMFISGLALLASVLYYHFSYTASPTPTPTPVSLPVSPSLIPSSAEKKVEDEVEEDDEEEEEEEKEKEEKTIEEIKLSEGEEVKKKEEGGEKDKLFEKDGADEDLRLRRPTVSWHIGSSPSMT